MKLQVYRVGKMGHLFPIGHPKTIQQVRHLYSITVSELDKIRLNTGEIVRKYDGAGTILFLKGEPTCSQSTIQKAESSTRATVIH